MKVCSKCGAVYEEGNFCMRCGGALIEKGGAVEPAVNNNTWQSQEYGVIEEPSKLQFILIGIIIAAACVAASVLVYLRSETVEVACNSQHVQGCCAYESTIEEGEAPAEDVL